MYDTLNPSRGPNVKHFSGLDPSQKVVAVDCGAAMIAANAVVSPINSFFIMCRCWLFGIIYRVFLLQLRDQTG